MHPEIVRKKMYMHSKKYDLYDTVCTIAIIGAATARVAWVWTSGSQPVARGPKVARQTSKSGPRPPREF